MLSVRYLGLEEIYLWLPPMRLGRRGTKQYFACSSRCVTGANSCQHLHWSLGPQFSLTLAGSSVKAAECVSVLEASTTAFASVLNM
jgi:hypothetical protein